MPRYLTPANTFDRAAIMRAAWVEARAQAFALAAAPAPFRKIITVRAAFGQALARVWGIARSERDYAVWAAEQKAAAGAEATRRAALPTQARAVEDAAYALAMAEQADAFTAENIAAQRAARARLVALQQAA